jgi:hypothetical protein
MQVACLGLAELRRQPVVDREAHAAAAAAAAAEPNIAFTHPPFEREWLRGSGHLL